MQHNLKLAVVGTGVVGQGVLYAWRKRGYEVTGYDVNEQTIQQLQQNSVEAYHIDDFHGCQADLVFICLPTPQSEHDGSIYLEYMRNGLNVIGPWIYQRVRAGHYPMTVMRSTMLPTLSRKEIIPHLEEMSSLTAGIDFGYAHVPEILRETDALDDSDCIWQVIIGKLDDHTAQTLEQMFRRELGDHGDKLITVVPVEVAEAAKVIVNTYNATVISYYNMMHQFLERLGIDGQAAIDLAARTAEGSLNCWYGTTAGYPYGGKCLPKDVAAVLAMADEAGLSLSQLQATARVNSMLEQLAEPGKVPKPIKDGFRRASAQLLRRRSLEAFDQLHSVLL